MDPCEIAARTQALVFRIAVCSRRRGSSSCGQTGTPTPTPLRSNPSTDLTSPPPASPILRSVPSTITFPVDRFEVFSDPVCVFYDRSPSFCNSIIRASIEKGSPHKALTHYKTLLLPDHRTLALVVKSCHLANPFDGVGAAAAHTTIIKTWLLLSSGSTSKATVSCSTKCSAGTQTLSTGI